MPESPKRSLGMRCNKATSCRIDQPVNEIGEGSFRTVVAGTYADGKREGERCVIKSFKPNVIPSDKQSEFFEKDKLVLKEAAKIVTDFMDYVQKHPRTASRAATSQKRGALNIFDLFDLRDSMNQFRFKYFHVNMGTVWGTGDGRCIVEPYIEDFQKFTSNTGGVSDDHATFTVDVGRGSGYRVSRKYVLDLMVALSHYSYHRSDGKLLLTDLQGGIVKGAVVLSDPVILSREQKYGPTDLGQAGIENFFHHHKCSEFCCHSWLKMEDPTKYFKPRMSTSMMMGNAFENLKLCEASKLDAIEEEDEEDESEEEGEAKAEVKPEKLDIANKLADCRMDPAELHYCQDSIRELFGDEKWTIHDTIAELREDTEGCLRRIPPIRVFKEDGRWFSEDNRRLACFKKVDSVSSRFR
jgi:hypothetical protein